jgi:hypothetical protein
MINPEEIEKVCVYEGEKRSNIVNEKVESFLDKCNEKTEKELIKLIDEILKDVESIDDLIKEKKYKNIKKTIKTNIIKNLYRLRCFFFNGPSDFVSVYYFCAFPLLSSGL